MEQNQIHFNDDLGVRYTYSTGRRSLVVQSAGNVQGFDPVPACQKAYRPDFYSAALPDDGVMVVGAVHHTGQAVSPTQRFSGTYPAGLSGEPPDTYFSASGECVDIWAPGNLILSTWGTHSGPNFTVQNPANPYTGNVNSTPPSTQGWAFLSGTSMAAPFVAAAAAWVADAYGLSTPAEVEQKLRTLAYPNTGVVDPHGYPVRIVQLP